jgi:hypothetical protein
MTCVPGRIKEDYMEEEYTLHRSGAETAANRKRRRVVCQICSASLQTSSLTSHLETQHDIYCLFILSQNIIVEHPAVVYHAIALTETGCYFCPVGKCIGGTSTWWNLRRHFLDRHPQDLVVCPSEGTLPLPRCTRCGMQTAAGALMRKHQETELCRERWRQQVQHETTAAAWLSLEMQFFAYGEELLEWVIVFTYLGRLLSYDDNDIQAMRGNLAKARRCWARVSRVLRSENALPKVCGVFYKATIQAVLLFWE